MVDNNLLHHSEILKPYLPPHLADRLKVDLSFSDASAIAGHISALRKVLTTYLPLNLVKHIEKDPTPGRMISYSQYGAVLFADVSGFTAMSEKLSALGKEGAEEMTLLVNDYFETMLEISNCYDGDLLKFGGDALMIFFEGMEGPHRAVTVAKEMQDSMKKYQEIETSQGTFALRMSIGIGSGPIFLINLGNAEEMDYAVMGSTLGNMAKAEDVAGAGQVIVDRTTQEATMSIASFSAVGDDLWLLEALQSWKFVAQDRVQERQQELSETVSSVDDLLDKSLTDLAYIEALIPYVPDELFVRLIPDPGRPIRYGSHRPVTMMFVNFYGIDEIIDVLGQEQLEAISKLFNEYFASMSIVINQYGGTINRVDSYVVGHRILALFGALQAHENDPERAVRAGLDMNRVLEGVNQRLSELLNSIPDLAMNVRERPLKQRIGINTGFVFAGNVGSSDRREFTVMGDQVNLTARLMSVADEGEILIGQNTSRHVGTTFELIEKEPVKVKGITDPVRNYVVMGEVEKPKKGMLKGVSPIVGRDAELEQGLLAVEHALEAKGCLLVVNGVSGIGKTRLVDEIIAHGTSVGMDLLLGTCLSYGSTLTYHPWAEVIRTYFGIRETDDAQARQKAVERGLKAIGEGDWTPVIGTVMGLEIPDNDLTRDLDAKLRRQRVLDLVVKLLQVQSQDRPLILEIEDTHWADSASMELINYVARNIVGHAILMILPHRPDEDLPDWTSYKHSIEIPLRDLSEPAGIEVVEGMLGPIQLPDTMCELIYRKAAGNPFFIKEVVHSLIDAGAFERGESGQWQVVEGKESVELPDTIHGIVISRVDRLDATHRRILQTASVVGRIFPYQTLLGVYAVDDPAVDIRPCLESMQNVGLVEVHDVDQDHYRFTHLTTQEVVYESLSFELRRNLHCGIGGYIEDAYVDSLSEQIDLLAYHYFEGQSWSKAVNYNLLAGQHAQREYANDSAITSCLRVLEAAVKSGPELDTSKEELAAHETLGDVFWLVGRYEESLESYTQARVQVDREGDSLDQLRHRADLCRKTAEVYERWSEYDQAFEWLETGLNYLKADIPTVEEARIYLMGTGLFRRQGKNKEAIEWCNRSIETASKIDSQDARRSVAQANYNLSGIYWRRGDFDQAIELSKKSIGIYQETHDIVGEARAYNNLAIAYSDRGDWGDAIEAYDESLKINVKIGNIQSQGFIENNLAEIYRDRGDWDKALEFYRRSNEVWKKLDAPLQDAVTLSNMAQVYLYQGNFKMARECLTESQDLFVQVGSEDFLPELDRRWGEYYLGIHELDDALSHCQKSIESASKQEARFEMGLSFRTMGEIYIDRGDFESAEFQLLQSLRILDDLNSEYEAAKTRVVLAKLSLNKEISGSPKEEIYRAVEVFKELGAEKDLERAKDLKDRLEARI